MLHMIYIMYKQVPGKHRPLQQQQKHDAAAANMQPGPSTGIRMLLSLSTITAMIPPPDQQAVPTNLLGTATHQSSTGGTITSWGDFSHAPPPPPPIWGLGGSSIGDWVSGNRLLPIRANLATWGGGLGLSSLPSSL